MKKVPSSSSSSSQRETSSAGMESPELGEEPPVPGSYLRSVVQQMSSSRPRELAGTSSSDGLTVAGELLTISPPPPKKPVRRRLSATRPRQDRLLNMAEARREIVAALKFHREAMKHGRQKQTHRRPPPSSRQPSSPFPPLSSISPPCSYHPRVTAAPFSDKLLNFPLPNPPLGLSLNLHAFPDVQTPLFRSGSGEPPILRRPTSSPSPSSPLHSHTSPSTTARAAAAGDAQASAADPIPSDPLLHPAMGDEEMEEIRSMSERHGVEWNDAVNSASTAWWSRLLGAMEGGGNGESGDGDAFQMFGNAMTEMPGPGMKSGQGSCLFESHRDDDELQDLMVLPW